MFLYRTLLRLNSDRSVADRFLDELLLLYKSPDGRKTKEQEEEVSASLSLLAPRLQKQLQKEQESAQKQNNDTDSINNDFASSQSNINLENLLLQLLKKKLNYSHMDVKATTPEATEMHYNKTNDKDNVSNNDNINNNINIINNNNNIQSAETAKERYTFSFIKRLLEMNPHVSFQEILLRWKATVNHPLTCANVLPYVSLTEVQLLNQKINEIDEFAVLKGPEKRYTTPKCEENVSSITTLNDADDVYKDEHGTYEERWYAKEQQYLNSSISSSSSSLSSSSSTFAHSLFHPVSEKALEEVNTCTWEIFEYYSVVHFAAELGSKELFDYCKSKLHDGVCFKMRDNSVDILAISNSNNNNNNNNNKRRKKKNKVPSDQCNLWPLTPINNANKMSQATQRSASHAKLPHYEAQHSSRQNLTLVTSEEEQQEQKKEEEEEEEEEEKLYLSLLAENEQYEAAHTTSITELVPESAKSNTSSNNVNNDCNRNSEVHGLVSFDLLAKHGYDYHGAYLSHYAAQCGQIDIIHELINCYGANIILREQHWQVPLNTKMIWGAASHLTGLSSVACAIACGQINLLKWLLTYHHTYLTTLPQHELSHALLALGLQLDDDDEMRGHAVLDFLWNNHLLVPSSITVISSSSPSQQQELEEEEQYECSNATCKFKEYVTSEEWEEEWEREQVTELEQPNYAGEKKQSTAFGNSSKVICSDRISLIELSEGKEAMAMLFAAAEAGNIIVTNWFIKTFGEEVLWMPGRGECTYLHHCVRGSQVKLLRHLLCERRERDCPTLQQWIDVADNQERTPAVWAVIGTKRRAMTIAVLELLKECGSHWQSYRDLEGNNLYEIARQCHSPFTKLCRYLKKEVHASA